MCYLCQHWCTEAFGCLSMILCICQIINTYTEAVQTVDPMKATGKPHSLWVSFARFYEENEQLDDVSLGFLFVCLTYVFFNVMLVHHF